MNADFIIKSIINRAAFLQTRKKKWAACPSERKRFQIIVELIQLEPSHLREPWIIENVILWQQDLDKYRDYIEAAFLKKGKRPGRTAKQQATWARNMDLRAKVDSIKKSIPSEAKAIRELIEKGVFASDLDMQDVDIYKLKEKDSAKLEKNSMQDPWNALKQRLKRLKGDDGPLPFPYYGRNVIKWPDRIQFKFYDTRIKVGETNAFGEWSTELPIDPETSAKFDAMYVSICNNTFK